MKISINMTDTSMDLDRFESPDHLRRFYKQRGLDGLELMPCMAPRLPQGLEPRDVVGIHLRYYPCWLDYWQGNQRALLREFGSNQVIRQVYGDTREDFLRSFQDQLDLAQAIGAQYVVFHVSECTLEECLHNSRRHGDLEVVTAAAQLINTLLEGRDYSFWFLTENLWWSGLNLMDNAVTRALMEGIRYEKKGIMLDTGHLLHTNLEIRDQQQGIAYIHQVLDRMGDLTGYIRGVHLNQSISGDYVKSVMEDPPTLPEPYWERLSAIYPHVAKIDYHEPFTDPGAAALIRRIRPEFVTIELITRSLAHHARALDAQLKALKENGGME